ncbi:MAG: TMEM175 family protein [Leucobacter sp.]
MAADSEHAAEIGFAAERTKAFVDAVVAIAMTLLILPLMDSVGEGASEGDDALEWLIGHAAPLVNFVLSFVLIAMFWMIHHRLFAGVERVTVALTWILAAWMLTIVWLPVATAIAGWMSDNDPVAKTIYIGSLTITALVSLVVRLYVRAHPGLCSQEEGTEPGGTVFGLADDIALVVLFAIALALALLIPGIGYYALLVMLLSGFAQKLFAKVLGRRSRQEDQT